MGLLDGMAWEREFPPENKTTNMNDILIANSFYCQEDRQYGIDGETFSIPFNKQFTVGNIIHNGFDNCPKLFVDAVGPFDPVHHCFEHRVQVASNKNEFYKRKYLMPGTRFFQVPTFDDSRKIFEEMQIAKELVNTINNTDWKLPEGFEHCAPKASLVDIMKPHQLLYNRRMAGEKLTDEENKILDAGLPVQKAHDEFVKALDEHETKERQKKLLDGNKKIILVNKKAPPKYFHPNLEDLYPGYECEKKVLGEFDRHICYPNPECYAMAQLGEDVKFEPYTITKEDIIDLMRFTGDLRNSPGYPIVGWFRTPLLTKKQVEDEGWDVTHPDLDMSLIWGTRWMCSKKKDDTTSYKMNVDFDNTILIIKTITNIEKEEITFVLFNGECKDINILRKISKLINL